MREKISHISYVWEEDMPFVPWAGGTEAYTLRQMSDLRERDIPTRLIVVGKTVDTDLSSVEVPVLKMRDKAGLAELDDTLLFSFKPLHGIGAPRRPSYVMLHVPIRGSDHDNSAVFKRYGTRGSQPIVTSKYMAAHWKEELSLPEPPPVVYPPSHPAFSQVERPAEPNIPPRVLFAGRPVESKGVFTLLESLDDPVLRKLDFRLTCVRSDHAGHAPVNELYDEDPRIEAVAPRRTPASLAKLYSEHDMVVVPSIWKEAFGMVALEAQQAGSRVVASDIGGLPETDCGGLLLVEPDNPHALAEGIAEAIRLGPLDRTARAAAAGKFTVRASVDALLQAIGR